MACPGAAPYRGRVLVSTLVQKSLPNGRWPGHI